MSELTFECDSRTNREMQDLMNHYRVKNKAEIISKALTILKIASMVDKTKGELIARKGDQEVKINVR